ncbi:DUF3732 domain-containing protein [Pantoea dispersa]|uniref:DUF3732 domain-containing protein n=1 Tax=Pantoea dispersa TaxID=59814 RepID=UPI002221873A|nr:DUF3732 domain-containing protein [Pantoea dispersa]UYV56475.1 DUF3732 domain-containing protein [Pantoea dispersa]WEA04787.1 DUF3732 domain-containing protein [Pantoea dispersa]
MKFLIEKIILWPVNSDNAMRIIEFAPDKLNIIHGISGTGKSSIISIVDYCLGSSKCAIPVGKIRESVEWFGLQVEIKGIKCLICRRSPNQKNAGNEFYLSRMQGELPVTIEKATHNFSSFKETLNQLVKLSNLAIDDEKEKIGFDGRTSYRDMTAFNFLPQHIVANPYTLFFKADSYQNKERLKRIMPFALGIIDREYMIKEKELIDLYKRHDSLIRQQEINIKALSGWEKDISHLWYQAIELGLLNANQEVINESTDKLLDLKFINKKHSEGSLNDLLINPNYNYTNEALKKTIFEGEEIQRKIDDIRLKIRNYEQLFAQGQFFSNAIKSEKNHAHGFEWLKENLSPKGKCIACGNETTITSNIINNLEKKILKLNSIPEGLFDKPIVDKELDKLKKTLRDYQETLHSIRKQKIQLEKLDKSTSDSLQKVYVLIGRIQENLASLDKIKNTGDLSEQIKEIKKIIEPLDVFFKTTNIKSKESVTYSKVNSLIEKYADILNLERRGKIFLDKNELTLSFKESEYSKSEYLWEVGSGANWMGYHLSTFLALHEFLSSPGNENLPPFSFLIIDQPSQVYFPSAASGENILDEINSHNQLMTARENDILATKKIFEMLSSAIESNAFKFQVIVLEHADQTIWGEIPHTYEAAQWKTAKDGLIPKEWV